MKQAIACLAAAVVLLALLSAAAEQETTLYVCVEPTSYLKLRESPVDGEVRVRMERGEAVTLIETKDNWAHVACGSELGWACMDYLSDKPVQAELESATITSTGRVALRKAPDGKRVDWLSPGQTVTVYGWKKGKDAYWAHVDGGFVRSDCLELE